jgi:hypothetical protein
MPNACFCLPHHRHLCSDHRCPRATDPDQASYARSQEYWEMKEADRLARVLGKYQAALTPRR